MQFGTSLGMFNLELSFRLSPKSYCSPVLQPRLSFRVWLHTTADSLSQNR